MNKNSIKKCWRQIDEATEAIERLIDNGIISYNHWDTFEELVVLKQDIERITEINLYNDKSADVDQD